METPKLNHIFLTDIPHMDSKLGSDNSQTAFIVEP